MSQIIAKIINITPLNNKKKVKYPLLHNINQFSYQQSYEYLSLLVLSLICFKLRCRTKNNVLYEKIMFFIIILDFYIKLLAIQPALALILARAQESAFARVQEKPIPIQCTCCFLLQFQTLQYIIFVYFQQENTRFIAFVLKFCLRMKNKGHDTL